MAYTVRELIEALERCPQCFEVLGCGSLGEYFSIVAVGVDVAEETVDLFAEL